MGRFFLAAALLALGSTLGAEPCAAVSFSCGVAPKSACGHVKPTGAHFRACVEANRGTLAWPWGEELTHAVSVARTCEPDVKRFCRSAARAGDVIDCMTPDLSQLSDRRLTALAKFGVTDARKL